MKSFFKKILLLPRYIKQVIVIITDLVLCILSTWFIIVVIKEEIIYFNNINFYPALISIVIALPIFWSFGFYRTIFRYSSMSIVFNIFTSMSLYGLLYFLVLWNINFQTIPRSISVLQPIVLFLSVLSTRLFTKYFLTGHYDLKKRTNKKNVLVYGAGDAGRQLLASL